MGKKVTCLLLRIGVCFCILHMEAAGVDQGKVGGADGVAALTLKKERRKNTMAMPTELVLARL